MTEQAAAQEQPRDYLIPILGTFPGMDPALLEACIPEGAQAVILESNARASLASAISPVVKQLTDKGVPVIVLADVYGKNHGITHIADQPQQETLKAGAFYLETTGVGSPNADDGNQGNLEKIVDAVKAGIDQGLKGSELGSYVRDQFSYPAGEKPARPDPVEQLRAQHETLVAEGLGGLSLSATRALEQAEASRK